MTSGYVSNRKEISFESGKKRYYMLNTAPKKSFKYTVTMIDDGSATCEFRRFLFWYENTLLSGTETFLFTNLVTHSGTAEYRMTSEPSWSGQLIKEVTINVQEE